jgi:HPt (histidine-containing phosphotransfer) domain-containing protein
VSEIETIKAVFAATKIEGLDLETGVARFGGNPKLYSKIINTFVDNIGAHLDTLSGLTREGLEAYGIQVHGVKGSLYGISANREGDMARELEMSAKAGDYEKVAVGNPQFIDSVEGLAEKLRKVLTDIEAGGADGQRKPEPDKAALAVMLQASRDFDVEKMQETLKELEQYKYESGGDLVVWLGEQVTTFCYSEIEERLVGII